MNCKKKEAKNIKTNLLTKCEKKARNLKSLRKVCKTAPKFFNFKSDNLEFSIYSLCVNMRYFLTRNVFGAVYKWDKV